MEMLPDAGLIMAAIIRKRLDLPAPSEPTRPAITPRETVKLISCTARIAPKLSDTLSTETKESSQPGIGRHPCFQLQLGIGERNLDHKHQFDPLLVGLDDLWGKLAFRR